MNQFKDVFLGTGSRDYSRCANSQKCIRAGGKHNDLEEVGVDGYHHTFFEMLGNWSFGDYYKKEAIKWAWELLTEIWKLPKDKLWATVHHTDDESFELWKSETDINVNHILKFGDKDNFWEMGETGPCGPCSEIHIDLTDNGCSPEDINAGKEDVIEIWNLVFIQYNRDEKGELTPLPKKHVDTGMGFERTVRVLQKKKSNYETDVFELIINKIVEIIGKEYTGENISSINAIADHIRCLTFAIADGAIPSNEGRGYVLRRILRRALRLARKIDYDEPFLFELVDSVEKSFSGIFPGLSAKKDFIKEIIKNEEINFGNTLGRGLELFNEVMQGLSGESEKIFPGEEAFKLYDTYGFPIDLTQVMARENGLEVDMEKFDEEMKKQKERARNARKDDNIQTESGNKNLEKVIKSTDAKYNPYELNKNGLKTFAVKSEIKTDSETDLLILKENPFYSEAGGQISDTGKIILQNGIELPVVDVRNQYYIYVKNPEKININEQKITAIVDYDKRRAVQRNHSATHLVHEALRQVLGVHVKQMGSLVADEYLRFDFPHFKKVSSEEIREIEEMVNSKIIESIPVETLANLPTEEADKIPNVKRFFGDKYGDTVRIVIMDEKFSVEFCGGTHVSNTDDIGLFKIIKEESISSGVRRIFAKTGSGIIEYLNDKSSNLNNIIQTLPVNYSGKIQYKIDELIESLSSTDYLNTKLLKELFENQDKLLTEVKDLKLQYEEEKKLLDKQLLKQNLQKIYNRIDELISSANTDSGFRIVTGRIDVNNNNEFKEIGDRLKQKLNDGVGIIFSVTEGKINIVCSVGNKLVKEKGLNAGKIISVIAKELGGGGGGRADIATAGGRNTEKLDEVINKIQTIINNFLT
jgi:alanyl-tRNA synthetase